jgi:hypothetical protein
LSADPNIDGTYDAQGYNRYSYVGNNPLGATDPTGFFSLKEIGMIVAVVAISIITAGAALYAYAAMYTVGFASFGGALSCIAGGGFLTVGEAIVAGAAGGFAAGFAGSLLNGGSIGDAFKAGVIGAALGGVTGGITYGIGTISGDLGYAGTAAAHGMTQGLANEAVGGDFRHGFYAGAASSMLAPGISKVSNEEAVQVAAAAVVGGTASALGGGKFGNGAVSGAFTYMFNWASHSPFDVHRKALFEAIKASNGAFTREDAREMIRASHDMDRLKQWNKPETEFVHGLWCPRPGYSREDAMHEWYNFVETHFQNAVDLAAIGMRKEAMYELGLTMHAVQDPTSPSHFGFKIYDTAEIDHPFTNSDSLSHMAHELRYPGNDSALFRATSSVLNQFNAGRMMVDPLSYGHD